MSMHSRSANGTRGFTLLEVIMVIIVAAILGAMLVTFVGTNIGMSSNPVMLVQDQNNLNRVMENIVSDYRENIQNGSLQLNNFAAAMANKYGGSVDSIATAFVKYSDANGDGVYEESSCSYGSSGCKTLKITLQIGDQKVTSLFTE